MSETVLLVGWCPRCEAVHDPYPGAGVMCDGAWNDRHGVYKRRMWKCSHTDCYEGLGPQYFLTKVYWLEHEAEYAEEIAEAAVLDGNEVTTLGADSEGTGDKK